MTAVDTPGPATGSTLPPRTTPGNGRSGRGTIPGLPSAHRIVDQLPAILQGDEFARRFTGGLDEVLAPVFGVLDALHSYVDPAIAPEDFLAFVAGWVGANLDEDWPLQRRRALVADAAALDAWRGTVTGLRDLLARSFDAEVEVTDSGGTAWSPVPGGALPGGDVPALVVRVRGPGVERSRVEQIVAECKPAHVPHRLEVADS